MPELSNNLFGSSPSPQYTAQKIEILILQNSISAASAIVQVLSQAGYRVNWQQAATTQEYQERLSPQLNLILYDASLNQLELTAAINLLSVNNLTIPLLVINGEASIARAVRAIKVGATDYLPTAELPRLPAIVAQTLAQANTSFQQAQCNVCTQQQLQQLIADNADGIIVVSDRGIVQFVNPAALELFGKSTAELVGEPLGFPVVNGDYLEVDIPQSPEKILVAQMRVSQIQWQGKNAYVVSLRDITQIKQIEAERVRLLEEAQAANRAKDQFLAILSHELRTPLNPIVGWSQLLVQGNLSEAQIQRGAKIIQRNAKLQSQLIDDILDISRIIRGKVTLKATSVNLTTVINNALETVKLAAQAKSIQINTDLNETTDLVRGDATRLQQVIWNLLTNAVKFTPHGGRVDISLTSVDNTVRVQIKDTGKGIEPEFLPYIFDYFRQAENAKTRANGGLGLGLAIVRHLVELHGGKIAVSSPGVGKGAIFTFSLPILAASGQSAPTIDAPQPGKNLQGVKVLVVDDDDSSRDLLVFILDNQGAETKSTPSATEALSIIEQFQPDILVSDIGMPGMDGYELIQRVRELSTIQNLRAIALSAYVSDADCQRSLAAGFERHINKPLDVANFLKVIIQLLEASPS